jgi:hypothetical protein
MLNVKYNKLHYNIDFWLPFTFFTWKWGIRKQHLLTLHVYVHTDMVRKQALETIDSINVSGFQACLLKILCFYVMIL